MALASHEIDALFTSADVDARPLARNLVAENRYPEALEAALVRAVEEGKKAFRDAQDRGVRMPSLMGPSPSQSARMRFIEVMEYERGLERVAQNYRQEGYTVIAHPEGEAVPPFAAGRELDMIAIRGDEKVVVGVRSTRSELAKDHALRLLADSTNKLPGWRFDLVILESESPAARVAENASEPSIEQILGMLDRVRMVARAGLNDAAIVYAWAALEAAMRRARDDVELHSRMMPGELLRTLYSNGILTRGEFDRAKEAWAIRSQAVHGFVAPSIDPALIDDLLAMTKKLIGSEEKVETAAAS